ncbi:hypothetical protein [uncultured Brevundimonas sp.]|jgi:hypothetical protein|uniref:hypothetical protein n=1 Tax=uncultured Brevundimonas sp. TaxID=213418 RepID=UPI002595B5D6|nr:hypothetical protein [uncultured Brevundimonas sp.]
MMRRLAASAAFLVLGLAGCDRTEQPAETASETSALEVEASQPAPAQTPADAPTSMAALGEAEPAAPGAPPFAALYPGATADTPAVIAAGDAGQGGLVTFETTATPDEVIAYYRDRAAQAGLRPVMGMNQGDARAYGAADGEPDGAKLSVVAAPAEGSTSVQLSWSEGR